MGLGPSVPPTELARWDSALFMEVKCIFFTTSEAEIFSKSLWIETEANGGHWGDRTLNRTWSRHDRTRPVSDSSSLARGLGFTTGVSGHSRDDAFGQAPEGQRTRWRFRSRSTGRVRS
jgi:hypothetical protein